MGATPLVSVLTPCHRKEDLPNVVKNFSTQTYPDKELILVVPDNTFIPPICYGLYRYIHQATLGDLRNFGILQSRGEIIVHMDGDDWYAPEYIEKSVWCLRASPGAELVGLNKAIYLDGNKRYQYEYLGQQKLVLGATMTYYRSTWNNHPFQPLQCGEDNVFCAMTKEVAYGDYNDSFMAIRRGNNTSFPNYLSSSFTRIK